MHGQSAPGLGGHCVQDDCLCVGVCEPEFFDGKQPTERDTRLSRWCERRTNSMKQEPDMTRKKTGFPETQIPPDFTAVGIEGIVNFTKTPVYKHPV